MQNKRGVVFSSLHLADYYIYRKDTLKALTYLLSANAIASKIKNNRDYLNSLKLLSIFDKENATIHLNKFISFNDSLQLVERSFRNKYARISYETDEYIEETEFLKKRNQLLTAIAVGVIIILLLTYFLNRQKSKNEKLAFEAELQKLNGELYLLELKKQSQLEYERVKERNRISEELHDSILGDLFGTRIGLGFLDLKANKSTKQKFKSHLDKLQSIEKEIREVSHVLGKNDINQKLDFKNLIEDLFEEKSKIGNFKFNFIELKPIDWSFISDEIKVNLYRVFKEALQNTIKHAECSNVSLLISESDKKLKIIIEDDGLGLEIKNSKKGIGLKNMRSRIQKLKGNFEIKSNKNIGTQINIILPLKR